MARRSARVVVQQLLDAMADTVRDYPPEVGRTGATVDELIGGTAFFPGGCSLWRGKEPGGPMPEHFPEAPIMLVAHNFDSIRAHQKNRIGEAHTLFWRNLLAYLDGAQIDPADVFFTNALMGCKPGSATGKMPSVPRYEDQCRELLRKQIEIVRPRITIALGQDALVRLRQVNPVAQGLMHPSALQYLPIGDRRERIKEQAARLAELIQT